MTRPHVLMFAKDVPWPTSNGYRLRLAAQVEGLTSVGDVDLVALSRDPNASPFDKPDSIRLRRYHILSYPARDGGPVRLARWLTTGRPRRLVGGQWGRVAPEILDLIDVEPDLVWWSHTDAWVALHEAVGGRSVLDFDNVNSARIAHRRNSPPAVPTADDGRALVGALRRWTLSGLDAVDERRWRRLEHRAQVETDATVVCSRLDLERIGRRSTHVIPNGYKPVFERVDARSIDPDRPTLLFVGTLTYEPNAEGVSWFVNEVLPLLRTHHPGARLRVVGRVDGALARQLASPGVDVLGPVADLGPELGGADVAIVPLRVGGGTRLKIVEAFASGIPVVSTSVGAEGLGVSSGEQLMIGDRAGDFAQACRDVITDSSLRQSLVRAGHAHFDHHFRWSAVCTMVADLAHETISSAGREQR